MKTIKVIVVMVALLLLGFQTSGHAVPILTLNDNAGHSVSITDQLAGDLNAAIGAVTWSGVLGVWDVDVSTGVTKPIKGSPADAIIDLNSINDSTAAGHMTITFYEDGFTALGGSVAFHVGGTTLTADGSYVSYQVLVNGAPVVTSGPYNPTAFSGNSGGSTGPVSTMSLVADIYHAGANLTSFDAVASVPEPSSLLLLGFGLAGVGLYSRQRKTEGHKK